jgi:hypothetical protein
MSQEQVSKRNQIDTDAASVISSLPSFGKLMVIGKANGATHERIGTIEKVENVDGWLNCSGENHASSMDPSLVSRIIFDTSSIMQEQVYPRIDFQDEAGEVLFAVVGFEGATPFEQGLSKFPKTAIEEKAPAARQARPDVADADPGAQPLKSALASTQPITIAFQSRGFRQTWTGVVEKVSPGMGFINIMRPDFHLHLLGGTVGSWQADANGTGLIARDLEDRETGLSLAAEKASVFAEAEQA